MNESVLLRFFVITVSVNRSLRKTFLYLKLRKTDRSMNPAEPVVVDIAVVVGSPAA